MELVNGRADITELLEKLPSGGLVQCSLIRYTATWAISFALVDRHVKGGSIGEAISGLATTIAL
jgi:hypothetical protein